jgi:hypothetical protein
MSADVQFLIGVTAYVGIMVLMGLTFFPRSKYDA